MPNAFVASVSRLGYALARDRWAPRMLTRHNRHHAPDLSILTIAAIGGAGLLGTALFGWGTETIVFVPSVLVLATYILAAAAATKLFTGRLRLLAAFTITLLLATVPFAGWHLLLPPAIALIVAATRAISHHRQTTRDDLVDRPPGRAETAHLVRGGPSASVSTVSCRRDKRS